MSRKLFSVFFLFCQFFLIGGWAKGQSKENIDSPLAATVPKKQNNINYMTLIIESPRPLANLAEIVGGRLNAVITYEDPLFMSSNDLRPIYPGSPGYVPQSKRLCVVYPPTATAEQILKIATDMHNTTQRGGHYGVVKSQGFLGLVPTSVENNEGKIDKYRSILDTNIVFSLKKNATSLECLDTLMANLANLNPQVSILFGRIPKTKLSKLPYPYTRVNKSARDILTEILSIMNESLAKENLLLTWQFRYSPPIRNIAKGTWFLQFMPVKKKGNKYVAVWMEAFRPIASISEILQDRYKVVITYEDPMYECPCDILGKLGSGRAGLAGGIVDLEWDEGQDSVEKVLSLLMNEPIMPRDPAGMFAFKKGGTGKYCVYPLKARDLKGSLHPVTSFLDKRITFTMMKNVSVAKAAAMIAGFSMGREAIPLATGSDDVARIIQKVPDKPVLFEAHEARSALDYVLSLADPNLSWQFLFDPNSEKYQLFVCKP